MNNVDSTSAIGAKLKSWDQIWKLLSCFTWIYVGCSMDFSNLQRQILVAGIYRSIWCEALSAVGAKCGKSKEPRSRLQIWSCFIELWSVLSNGFAQQPEPQKLILVAVFSLNFSFRSLQTAEQSWRESWLLRGQDDDFLAFFKNRQNRCLMQY